ncbi:nuclear egress membrane protein [Eptesicus fuscus gammaherpesvirus]|uniref:Nuclear egress membrane protein n=1 Tax=vespertilionid gammaherpesvirus 3 TaxID=2846598 RepID=A0A2D1A8W6_9GAMA|nr:nuclear egress membrane protein [Eptesicus fuscus gammaherpesvirus]ATA58298.1 nuclear egress membrane protein [Eptesicus fuscus gammaherpesvirus]WAH70916.1 nuclear egress membrane protein [Eptesicus fuscus gammaherpesvirus]
MNNARRLIDELCHIVTSFICHPGIRVEIEKCPTGPHVFAKGGTQAICTVKLEHAQIYNIEFVYRYWTHKLETVRYPFSPCFIISNNGLATTLKCFLCAPQDVAAVACAGRQPMDSDVPLPKNASVVICQDDFVKFKTQLLFSKDLNIFNSMVVCRTYLTNQRQTLQFLVVKPKSQKRVSTILRMISETLGLGAPEEGRGDECDAPPFLERVAPRRPIRESSLSRCHQRRPRRREADCDGGSEGSYSDAEDDIAAPKPQTSPLPRDAPLKRCRGPGPRVEEGESSEETGGRAARRSRGALRRLIWGPCGLCLSVFVGCFLASGLAYALLMARS